MDFETKNLSGRNPSLVFRCERCGSTLKAPLQDAGTSQSCPDCGSPFKVPGTETLHEWAKQQVAKAAKSAQRHSTREATRTITKTGASVRNTLKSDSGRLGRRRLKIDGFLTREFPALNFTAWLYRICGFGLLVLWVLCFLWLYFGGVLIGLTARVGNSYLLLMLAFLVLILGVLVFVGFIAAAESIELFLRIERNTRTNDPQPRQRPDYNAAETTKDSGTSATGSVESSSRE